MSKLWVRMQRNGNAEVVKAAFVAVGIIVLLVALVIVSPGGIELFDTLKGM
jgi:hypothetical protein